MGGLVFGFLIDRFEDLGFRGLRFRSKGLVFRAEGGYCSYRVSICVWD